MVSDRTSANRCLLQRTKIYKADDPRVGCTKSHRELAEVFVQRHHDLFTLRCTREDLIVTWIGGPVTDPFDFVTSQLQFLFGSRPDAAVEQ